MDDLKHGHIPNIFAEKGWKAEFKHNPKGLATKILVTAAVATVAYTLFFRTGKSRR